MSGAVNWDFMFDPPSIHEDDNCPDCHEVHEKEGDVAKNALEWPAQFTCCVERFAEMKAEGEICARHPLAYHEAADKKTGAPLYCEACSDSVRAAFAYYYEMDQNVASYIILASDHADLPKGANVGADQLLAARVNIPITPTFETWVRVGRPVYRGEVRS